MATWSQEHAINRIPGRTHLSHTGNYRYSFQTTPYPFHFVVARPDDGHHHSNAETHNSILDAETRDGDNNSNNNNNGWTANQDHHEQHEHDQDNRKQDAFNEENVHPAPLTDEPGSRIFVDPQKLDALHFGPTVLCSPQSYTQSHRIVVDHCTSQTRDNLSSCRMVANHETAGRESTTVVSDRGVAEQEYGKRAPRGRDQSGAKTKNDDVDRGSGETGLLYALIKAGVIWYHKKHKIESRNRRQKQKVFSRSV